MEIGQGYKSAGKISMARDYILRSLAIYEMRDEQRVNPRDFRKLRRVGDSRRVAPHVLVRIRRIEAGEADVDHEGLAGGRHEQGGLPALSVDEVDVERLPRRERRGAHQYDQEQRA